MTDPIAAKLLDELIICFDLHQRDLTCVDNALAYIKLAHKEHGQPITVSLARLFDKTDKNWRTG